MLRSIFLWGKVRKCTVLTVKDGELRAFSAILRTITKTRKRGHKNEKKFIILIFLAICFITVGCSQTPPMSTITERLSETTQEEPICVDPPISLYLKGEAVTKLLSFDSDDIEGIAEFLADDEYHPKESGFWGWPLSYGHCSEENLYKIIDFLQILRIPKIKGAEVLSVQIYPNNCGMEYYNEKIEIVYQFEDTDEPDNHWGLFVEYTYADGVTFEQKMEEAEYYEVIECENNIRVSGLVGRETNAEEGRTFCIAELEGYPVKIVFLCKDSFRSGEPINAVLLNILKNDITFTSFFATDELDKAVD